ncbi:MAG: hypothetical protein LQ346_000512 [Caloplaca aetnensis]|nr:MAG: hypothetical protein LQ346_000512 [Caloplaca aetnensis]
MDSSGLDRHLSSGEEAQLAEALELRRKQIDREIAEYKAEKEKEFWKFEKRLRSEKRDNERQKILQCEREVEKANIKRRGSKGQRHSHSESGQNGRGTSETVSKDTRANGVRFGGATEIPQERDTGQKTRKSKDSGSQERPVHEREVEFQGLFTPTYLPLLNGHHHDAVNEGVSEGSVNEDAVKRPSATLTQDALESATHASKSSKSDAAESRQKAMQSSAPTLPSAAAPMSGSAPLTLADPHHLSSSDPRKRSMSERRSSSRSDTSVSSLRSSLRDPKHTRSPKRVLFSIDNVVVSPSTSPAMQRKINASKKGDSIDIVSKLEMSEIDLRKGEEKFDSYGWRRDSSNQSSKSALTNIPNTNGHSVNNGIKLASHPAAQIALGSTSPSMGSDGFEHIRGAEEDDDLFAFDEDIRYQDKDSRTNDGVGTEEELLDDVIIKRTEELPTSSPHAGSLPIEIRWPGRRESRA